MEETNFFNQNMELQGFGLYRRREVKVDVVDGVPRIVEELYQQALGPDGVPTILACPRYLCQGCGTAWIVLGLDGFWWKNLVLCRKCLRSARFKWFLKPFWSLFVRVKD
jgi:hypothetical protein